MKDLKMERKTTLGLETQKVKDVNSLQLIHRFNIISIKTLPRFFKDTDEIILKFCKNANELE